VRNREGVNDMSETTQIPPSHSDQRQGSRFEPGPATVVKSEPLAPNLHLLTVHAPAVAAKIQPGQFIILRADEHGERTPLTVADWDREAGTVSCVFMQVGTSTYKLGELKEGDVVPTFVGPLGKPVELEKWGTVMCAGGCYGIAGIYPIVRGLKELGNEVIVFIEGRSGFLLYWLDRLEAIADRVIIATRDGSMGEKEGYPHAVGRMLGEGEHVDRVVAIGCTFMMYEMSETTRPFEVKTVVSLNPIMIDGTGMCGACRVSIDGETRFACVDGPDFDGHKVDWDLLFSRRKAYLRPETDSAER
jgi:ferredoxin--NADP+ reductase